MVAEAAFSLPGGIGVIYFKLDKLIILSFIEALSLSYSGSFKEFSKVYMATRLFLNISQSYIPFYIQDSLRVEVAIKCLKCHKSL